MDLGQFFTQSATVETYLGAGPTGDLYAAPVTVMGLLDDGVVREQTDHGVQLVAQTKWYCDLADADKFIPGSKITVNGRVVYVAKMRPRLHPVVNGMSHTEVDLR